jgi:hypothetical protein
MHGNEVVAVLHRSPEVVGGSLKIHEVVTVP